MSSGPFDSRFGPVSDSSVLSSSGSVVRPICPLVDMSVCPVRPYVSDSIPLFDPVRTRLLSVVAFASVNVCSRPSCNFRPVFWSSIDCRILRSVRRLSLRPLGLEIPALLRTLGTIGPDTGAL